MKRLGYEYLLKWKGRSNRRPMIIRGARQVGKTYLVRDFGKHEFETIIEYNFDNETDKRDIFLEKDINNLLNLIAIDKGKKIVPGKTLLFLDEIQAVPELIAKLRYFYEIIPELHIIAAGSLLDFTLADHEYSMPVGRIEYLFLGPMTFSEFLIAKKEEVLLKYLNEYQVGNSIPMTIHDKCMKYLKHYFYTGGMPSAINAYLGGDILEVGFEQKILLQTYIDDFNKYKNRVDSESLKNTFEKVPQMVGERVKYVNISLHERSREISKNISLLKMARVIQVVYHSSANGIPLGANTDSKRFKLLFLDIGLMLSSLKINLVNLETIEDVTTINNGALAEQFIGQHLLSQKDFYEEPSAFYWMREKSGTCSEIDYVTDMNGQVVPIEVKAGKTGTLKSLHVFISKKNSNVAVRFNSEIPSVIDTVTAVKNIDKKEFKLISLPLYMVDEMPRILKDYVK